MGQELVDLGGTHFQGMTFVMEEDEAANPVDVSLFGTEAMMPNPDGLADAVEQARLADGWNGRRWRW
jgi:hypothetical protein